MGPSGGGALALHGAPPFILQLGRFLQLKTNAENVSMLSLAFPWGWRIPFDLGTNC